LIKLIIANRDSFDEIDVSKVDEVDVSRRVITIMVTLISHNKIMGI
jgi:hypothetical protein